MATGWRCTMRLMGRASHLFRGVRQQFGSTRAYSSSASLAAKDLDVGQPTFGTHPELLSTGEILPGISSHEFASRRQKLRESLPEGSLVILGAAPQKKMTDAVPYPYRQDADYLYFTGCLQPGGIAVIDYHYGFWMFLPDRDPEKEIWDGRLAGPQAGIKYFGADKSYSSAQIDKILPDLLRSAESILFDTEYPNQLLWGFPDIKYALETHKIKPVHNYTHKIRWRKSLAEAHRMREVAAITCQAFLQTMLVSRHFSHEHILAATVEHECKIRGAHRMSFPTVSAGGANASVIHYSRNDKQIEKGQMVLMDAGCELHGYVSDMTRTWPISGTFSSAQREVYEIVLEAMKECFKLCRPNVTLREIHIQSGLVLSRGLLKLGLIRNISNFGQNFRAFNPTAVGHYLGMDVHDCATVSLDVPLQPGVVITIEPALYIPTDESIPERYRGMGVRIEDEVLITPTGHEVLTASVPKEVEEVESWLAQEWTSTHPLAFCSRQQPKCLEK